MCRRNTLPLPSQQQLWNHSPDPPQAPPLPHSSLSTMFSSTCPLMQPLIYETKDRFVFVVS